MGTCKLGHLGSSTLTAHAQVDWHLWKPPQLHEQGRGSSCGETTSLAAVLPIPGPSMPSAYRVHPLGKEA